MKKSSRRSGFTLVELLVVITIIAVLAGLAIPGINSALKRARQTAQVSDARNIGTVMFTYSTDNNGNFPTVNDDTDYPVTNTSTQVFTKLFEKKYLDSYEIAAGHKTKWKSGTFDETNNGWSMTKDLRDSDSDQLPMVFGADDAITAITAGTGTEPVTVTLTETGPWGTDGLVIMTKGNQAKFEKANKEGEVSLVGAGYRGGARVVLTPGGGD